MADSRTLNNTIQSKIAASQASTTGMRIGVITSYNDFANTATVLISAADSDEIDEVLTDVPCPVYMGVQGVAPEPGRMCVVVFKNGSITQPLIVNFFNQSYKKFDYLRHNKAGYTLPQYMMGM